jgi:hypothetical protein
MPGIVEVGNPVSVQFKLWPTAKAAKAIRKPLFTDNAQVYYKPGSLAPGGVGTVSNVGAKSRRT